MEQFVASVAFLILTVLWFGAGGTVEQDMQKESRDHHHQKGA